MVLKLKTGMIFLVIALCALVGVASAATGAGIAEEAATTIGPLAEETPLAAEGEETEIVDGNETSEEASAAPPVDTSINGQLASAAQKLSTDMSNFESAIQPVYDNVNGVVMVYVINPRGIIEAVYPDEYSAAVGDFIGRSAVGGVVLKAREYTETKEYTTAREGITGYDVVQPIISSDGKYLGAIVAKFSS